MAAPRLASVNERSGARRGGFARGILRDIDGGATCEPVGDSGKLGLFAFRRFTSGTGISSHVAPFRFTSDTGPLFLDRTASRASQSFSQASIASRVTDF